MPPVLRRWGRQEEQPEELDSTFGSIGGSATDNRVEQLAAKIGDIRQEMQTLIGLLAEHRQPRQDQAPPAPPQSQAPIAEQQPVQPGQYLSVSLYEFQRNKPPVFSGIEHNTDP